MASNRLSEIEIKNQIDEKWAKIKRTIEYMDGAYKNNPLFICEKNLNICNTILEAIGFDIDKIYYMECQ